MGTHTNNSHSYNMYSGYICVQEHNWTLTQVIQNLSEFLKTSPTSDTHMWPEHTLILHSIKLWWIVVQNIFDRKNFNIGGLAALYSKSTTQDKIVGGLVIL